MEIIATAHTTRRGDNPHQTKVRPSEGAATLTYQIIEKKAGIADSSTEANESKGIQFAEVYAPLETTAMAQTVHLESKLHQIPEIISKELESEKEGCTIAFTDQGVDENAVTEVQYIKQEPASNNIFGIKHCFDNQAPLCFVDNTIKEEFDETMEKKKTHTYFTDIDIEKTNSEKIRIREGIAFYKQLNNEAREQYLNERLSTQKHDGSIFSELKGQDEVITVRNINRLEILGHYAGRLCSEDRYKDSDYTNSTGTHRITIDRYRVMGRTCGYA